MKFLRPFPFLIFSLGHAQVYTPPPAQPAPVPASEAAPAPAASSAKSPLGQEIPMLDPAAETITVGGVPIPLGDNRILKARFEKYLNQPPESDEAAEEYRKTLQEILATISPFRSGGPDLYSAFKMLPAASSYPGDANICGSLAESIYMAMLSRQDVNALSKLNQSIEEEKNRLIRENDWSARHAPRDARLNPEEKKTAEKEGTAGATTGTAKPEGSGSQSLQYQDKLRRIGEIEVLKKANIVKTEAQTVQTKAQYQVSMVQWFAQRRYEHVLMAARFYNQIWKDGDSKLYVKEGSDVAKLFSESVGVSPTVASLDSLSNEAIREVDQYIQAFDLLLSRDELHSASQRLMEAYALGEYLAPVATLPLEKKRRISLYVRDLHELYGTLQARDYTKTLVLANRLKESAKDFPSSKVDSAIAAYTLASDLAIEEAKGHLLAKENEKAAEKIKSATEIWPTNPKLMEFRNLVNRSGGVATARNDFDRLLSEKNYREIARRQYEIAPSIQGDAVREDAFKQIMTSLTQIETALGKAAEFSKVGQNYAAWEQLAELREQFPDDPKLGRELELLAPKVADFTKALDRARQFENRTPKQTGSALAWYLKARAIYPQSGLAETGIQRQLDDILPDDAAPSAN
jgi:hypothetical protein